MTTHVTGDTTARLFNRELSAMDFHALLPGALGTPELETVAGRVKVVVYRDGWPAPVTGVVGVRREKPGPGAWDVCVVRTDGQTIEGLPYIVYTNVMAAGSPILSAR